MNENYLIHFGVKGMRWGVRRNPDSVRSIMKRTMKKENALGKRMIKDTWKSQNTAQKAYAKIDKQRAEGKDVSKLLGRGNQLVNNMLNSQEALMRYVKMDKGTKAALNEKYKAGQAAMRSLGMLQAIGLDSRRLADKSSQARIDIMKEIWKPEFESGNLERFH